MYEIQIIDDAHASLIVTHKVPEESAILTDRMYRNLG